MNSANPPSGGKQIEKRKHEELQTGDETNTHSKHSPCLGALEKRQRIIGPALPPSHIYRDDSDNNNIESDSDGGSDDDIGPSLPPPSVLGSGEAGGADAEVTDIHGGDRQPVEDVSVPSAEARRDEWMLLPPGQLESTLRVDPTKLRNRKFNTGRGARAPDTVSHGPAASWIETPEQKIRRLENEVMGIVPTSTGLQQVTTGTSKADEATAERIQLYNVS